MNNRLELEVHRVNGRFLELLTDSAQHDARPMFALVTTMRRELKELDDAARIRVGQRPYFLMNFCFHDDPWWDAAKTGAIAPPGLWTGHCPRESAVALARRVLTLVWHAADTHSAHTSIALGLAPKVAEIMRGMQLDELDDIAERYIAFMRPRWPDKPALWRRLLEAASANHVHTLQTIDLHAAQLLANELMSKAV